MRSRATASASGRLSDIAEDVKRRLLKVPMVKKIDIYGKQAKKVYVEFSNERLAALGITPLQIAESLRNQNSVCRKRLRSTRTATACWCASAASSTAWTTSATCRSPPAAGVIKLGDFTTITRGYEDPPTYTVRHNGQQVLMLGIVMTDDGNIVDLGKSLETAVAKIQSELPYGVELERVADQPTVVSESVWEFERSLMEALAIVLVGVPAEPRLAHGHRRRAVGADRARRRRAGDARQWAGTSSASRSAR